MANKKGFVKFTNPNKSQFFPVLKKRVDTYFNEKGISRKANATMYIKSVVLLSMYLVPFLLIVLGGFPAYVNMSLWLIMGIGTAGVGMSVMHDANHGAYSENETVNKIMGHSLNLLGGSVYNWKMQHNILHHTYTNITHMDEDIDDKLIMRFSPHTNRKSIQKFQFLYAFLFYGIMTLYWAVLKDLVQFVKYTKNGVNTKSPSENTWFFIQLVFIKSVYFFTLLYVPIVFFNIPAGQIIGGFLLMHYFSGLILTVIFQLAHTVEGTDHPLPNLQGNIENDWAIHQMNTTVNFARKNKILSWYIGGLNYQVEHHLFPRICHVHYPAISEIVKETAEEFGVPYLENETFAKALKSHIAVLNRFGTEDKMAA